jgi:hypothetical protein
MDLTMMERVGDRWEKNGRILFDRPKPTVDCSANGRRRRRRRRILVIITIVLLCELKMQFKHVT